MRVLATCIVALGLIASPAMAGTTATGDKGTSPAATGAATTTAQPDSGPTPASTPAAAAATPAKPEESSMESELQQLRDLLEAQSKQLQEQQEKMQLLEEKLNASSSSSASPTASIPPTSCSRWRLVRRWLGDGHKLLANAQPNQDTATTPNSINIKGISLTPAASWRRKRCGARRPSVPTRREHVL